MKSFAALSLLLASTAVHAHGGHDHANDNPNLEGAAYAIRHMASEHHIDQFDLESFFQLHDLNRDGTWDREEIEAIYGVHHVYSQKTSKDEIEHQKKADLVVDTVLKLVDSNKDGVITPEEFSAAGLKGLPNFDDIGAEGHHYDVESEFFLHHEEQFHGTPDTQTDESYVHAEDLEHFAAHEGIELKEAEREAKFQGVTVEEALRAHEEAEAAAQAAGTMYYGSKVQNPEAVVKVAGQQPFVQERKAQQEAEQAESDKPKFQREQPPEKQDPSVRFRDLHKELEGQAEWGSGSQGYKQPKSPQEKLRKNVPYKYKFRRNWGDF